MYLSERISYSCDRDVVLYDEDLLCLLRALIPGGCDVQVIWNVELRFSTILVRARQMLPSSG